MSDSNPHHQLAIVLKDVQNDIIEGGTPAEVNIPGLNRQDVLIGLLVDTLLHGYELNISHSTVDERVRETLQDMMNEHATPSEGYDDPVTRFREDWPEMSDSKSESTYKILIPVPLRGGTKLLPGKVQYNGTTLSRIDLDTWRRYEQRSREEVATDDAGYPRDLDELIQGTALEDVTISNYTFWKFESQGLDADYLIQQMESLLEVFFGQLSFVAEEGLPLHIDDSQDTIRAGPRTVFQMPPFYLVYRDSTFYRVQPGEYPIDTPLPRIRGEFYFEKRMSAFPPLSEFPSSTESIYEDDDSIHVRPVEATLGASFRTFGRAMRHRNPENAFLSLYRTLEHITFTKYANSEEPLKRALRLLGADGDDQVQELVSVVKDRRNTIVHDGTDVEITQTDLNVLKSLSMNAMETIGTLSQSHETDHIITYITTSSISSRRDELRHEIGETEEKISQMRAEMESLEEISEW